MPFGPGIRAFLDRAGADGWDPVLPTSDDPQELDAALATMRTPADHPDTVHLDGQVHEEKTPSGVRLRVYEPAGTDLRPIVVFMHGGGWVLGDLDMLDNVCRSVAQAGAVVVSVDYRLAPEHPYPTPLDDCAAAVRWAVSEGHRFGGDSARVVVMGSSAGGNLAAVLAVRARTDSTLPITGQVLVYPALDSSMSTPSYREFGQGYFLTATQMTFYWKSYAPESEARSDPEVSPTYTTSLDGVAPALIITAQADPLRDEAKEYARRLAKAGVKVQYREYAGVIHGFLNIPDLPEAAEAIDLIARAIVGGDDTLGEARNIF